MEIRPELLTVLAAMCPVTPTTPQRLAEKVGCIHLVLLALSSLYYDGLVDITTYCRTEAGTRILKLAEHR